MKRFTHFIFYNNTIPLMFGILFLGAGATFAASPEARDVVVGSESRVASIDNSYLLNTTIADATVAITIGSVTEDEDMYFVEYQMTTIEVVEAVWQPVTKTKVFEVQKSTIVGQDLGLYVEGELAELRVFETRKLRDYQARERQAGVTPKVVATEYSGLVGQFLDPNLEVFPGYDPLIDPSVGIPLTKEQEALHEQVRKEVEKAKQEQELAAQAGTQSDTENATSNTSGSSASSTQTGSGDATNTSDTSVGDTGTGQEQSPADPAIEPAPVETVIEPPAEPVPAPTIDSLMQGL